MQAHAGLRKNGHNSIKVENQDPPVRSGRTRRLLLVKIRQNPHTMLLHPRRDPRHRQPSSAHELRASSFHLHLETRLAPKESNKPCQSRHERIVKQSQVRLLRDEVDLVQSTPDTHNRKLHRLLKPRLHTGDTAGHGALAVSPNQYHLRLPVRVNHGQRLAACVELGFCCLVLEQRERYDVNI